MKLDAQSLAANFGTIQPHIAINNRVVIASSDQETINIVTDSEVDLDIIQTIELSAGKNAVLHKVEPSKNFDEALLFFATRAGSDDSFEWQLDCDQQYHRKCPLNWFQLKETQDPVVRDCQVCNRQVHLASDIDQAKKLAADGWCTACPSQAIVPDYMLGDMNVDFDEFGKPDEDDWEF